MSGNVETTCELVRRNAIQYPDTPFLDFYDEVITYKELDERSNAFANYLLEKGVMLSHRGVVAGARIKTERVPISPADRGLCVLPLFHSGGLNDLAFPTMYRAATIVLRRGFSASEFWDCIERYQINAFYIVPTMWNILLRATESSTVDTSSLRFGISGAAPIPPEQLEECKRRFGVPILEAYGLTESSGGIAANTLERSKYGSVGLPFDGLDLQVFDPDAKPLPAGQTGEIVVRGEVVMKGYWNRADATAEAIVDGWLYTGDLGYLDDDGFLFIADRKKEMIIRGGVNVYPKEIENTIAEHPAVAAVAVIPEAHDKYGLDEVRVPKERVFLLRDWQLAQPVAYAFSAFHRFTAVTYKIPILEYMTGVVMLVAEANGIERVSHIRDRFVELIRYTETTKALAKAALSEPEEFHGSGLYVAKPLLSNMAKMHFASNFHEFVRDIQDIAGGLLVTQPTYRDWSHPELKPYLEQYLGGAEPFDAEERLKLFSMLRHLVASDFSGWHEVCTIHAEGSIASQKMMLMAEAPMETYKALAREVVGLRTSSPA